MPLQQTSGNVTADAYGGGVAAVPNYIEDVFSTYLYTGNGSTQTITNGIDLSTYGGLVWAKRRDAAINNGLWSTTSAGNFLISNATTANTALATGVTAFNTNGFSLGSGYFNTNAGTYVSWSFKQQPKFFTQVTYTGTGSARTISHDLGATPAFIIVKRTDTTSNWACYHTSLGATQNIALNATAAAASSSYWNNTSPTSTVFSVDGSADVNASGGTYIAYLYASNAGGFGLTGTDNVISCGSFTTDGSGNATVNLGYEPQWVLCKRSNGLGNWILADVNRGSAYTFNAELRSNTSDAEITTADGQIIPNAIGFTTVLSNIAANATYIYIAIRRGPMKVPTDATKVFKPVAYTNNASTGTVVTTGFVVDSVFPMVNDRTSGHSNYVFDRLRGSNNYNLQTDNTNAEGNTGWGVDFASNTGIVDNVSNAVIGAARSDVVECFQRAPGFFDEVCYNGSGTNITQTHNLKVVPELIIVKARVGFINWAVYSSAIANTEYLILNSNSAKVTSTSVWNSTTPTSTVFSLGNGLANFSAVTYVAYLFASCPGVSKVGSYTGTGATQTISCGFTGGARFVMVKRTDTTGDWYYWDTARGMVAGTDPSILMNTTAGQVNANSIYTTTGGFQIVSTAAGINASGGSYIYLAIA